MAILTIYRRCLFFQFWGCGIRMNICILTRVQKGRIYGWKQGHILLKNVFLKINFEHEGRLYANCLFWYFSFFIKCFFFQFSSGDIGHLYDSCLLYIFTIGRKWLLLQFLGYGIGMKILILKEIQKKHISGWKTGHNLLKNKLFQLNFQNESNLYANCLFYILSFYNTCLFCQFLDCGIRIHIPILKGAQNGRISHQKIRHNLLNTCIFSV